MTQVLIDQSNAAFRGDLNTLTGYERDNGIDMQLLAAATTMSLWQPSRGPIRQRYLSRVVVPMLRILGPSRVDRLARFMVSSVPATNEEYERRLHDRLLMALGLSRQTSSTDAAGQIGALRQASRLHHARFWAELPFVLAAAGKPSFETCIDNFDQVHQALVPKPFIGAGETGERVRSETGAIYVSACWGNPVVAALAVLRARGELTVVADFDEFPMTVEWRRHWEHIDGLQILNRTQALSELPRLLSGGVAVFMLGDQFRYRGAGVSVSWLGKAGIAYRTMGLLAARHNIPIIPIAAERTDEAMRFRLHVEQSVFATSQPDETVRKVWERLEGIVLSDLGQYYWNAAI